MRKMSITLTATVSLVASHALAVENTSAPFADKTYLCTGLKSGTKEVIGVFDWRDEKELTLIEDGGGGYHLTCRFTERTKLYRPPPADRQHLWTCENEEEDVGPWLFDGKTLQLSKSSTTDTNPSQCAPFNLGK